jgi:cardiolipin synthase (CMP-forming)
MLCKRWFSRQSSLRSVVVTIRRSETVYINVPNFITLARVLSVPVIFWLLVNGNSRVAFFVFVCAGISDAVDGYLAKRFNWTTELGAYLDPLADKLLIVSIYIALGVSLQIPLWLVIAVVSRDILILLAVLISWLMDHPVRIKPLAISKINTAAQLILAATVLADEGFTLGLETTRLVLVWATAASTILSLVAYLKAWLMHMAGYESQDAPP